MSTSKLDIGGRIARLRNHLGYSQAKFAVILGASRGYLGDIEVGRSMPSRRIIDSIMTQTEVSYDWLMRGEGDMLQRRVQEIGAKYIHNQDLVTIKAWLDDFWAGASEQERSWLIVQMQYTFPQFRNYLKGDDNV